MRQGCCKPWSNPINQTQFAIAVCDVRLSAAPVTGYFSRFRRLSAGIPLVHSAALSAAVLQPAQVRQEATADAQRRRAGRVWAGTVEGRGGAYRLRTMFLCRWAELRVQSRHRWLKFHSSLSLSRFRFRFLLSCLSRVLHLLLASVSLFFSRQTNMRSPWRRPHRIAAVVCLLLSVACAQFVDDAALDPFVRRSLRWCCWCFFVLGAGGCCLPASHLTFDALTAPCGNGGREADAVCGRRRIRTCHCIGRRRVLCACVGAGACGRCGTADVIMRLLPLPCSLITSTVLATGSPVRQGAVYGFVVENSALTYAETLLGRHVQSDSRFGDGLAFAGCVLYATCALVRRPCFTFVFTSLRAFMCSDTVVVGAPRTDVVDTDEGAAYVRVPSATPVRQQSFVTAATPPPPPLVLFSPLSAGVQVHVRRQPHPVVDVCCQHHRSAAWRV